MGTSLKRQRKYSAFHRKCNYYFDESSGKKVPALCDKLKQPPQIFCGGCFAILAMRECRKEAYLSYISMSFSRCS